MALQNYPLMNEGLIALIHCIRCQVFCHVFCHINRINNINTRHSIVFKSYRCRSSYPPPLNKDLKSYFLPSYHSWLHGVTNWLAPPWPKTHRHVSPSSIGHNDPSLVSINHQTKDKPRPPPYLHSSTPQVPHIHPFSVNSSVE